MKAITLTTLAASLLLVVSCIKPKEPRARICPDEPLVITTADTIELENCSENYETQFWELPGGASSTQNKVGVTSNTPITYNIKLSVSNNDYANDYVTTRVLKVVSETFSTFTLSNSLTTQNDTFTVCTVVDDIDVNDPDGYYVTAGAPNGYELIEQLPNGCYRYGPDPQNPPTAGVKTTYHYYCINNKYCDTTKVEVTVP